MKISAKNQIMLEPSANVDLATEGVNYTTPDAWAVRLGRTALWNEKEAYFKFKLQLNQASSAGVAVVKLTAGTNVISETTLDLTDSEAFNSRVYVDLAGIEGQTLIKASVEVTTAGQASTSGVLDCVLEIESPLILSGC
jgi:hypothetical protein